ncbi:hypothetical protein MferCBS49748_003039 [Microsporum ferrugineum]
MCVKVVREITDVGLARYDVIRPILQKIENPQQLHELEQRSPHLLEHDAELWIEFIKRDIYFWESLDLSETPESWYRFYTTLREKAAKKVDEDAERMRRALQGLDKEKSKHTPKIVDIKKMRLPREKPTSVQRYAHHDRIMGGITPTFALNTKNSDSNNSKPWEDNSRWKLVPPKLPSRPSSGASSGSRKSALPAAVKRNPKLSTPTHQLNSMASRVSKAPKSFIEDHKPVNPIKRSIRPALRTSSPIIPSSPLKHTAAPLTAAGISNTASRRAPIAQSIFLPPKPRVTRSIEIPKSNFRPTTATQVDSCTDTPHLIIPNDDREHDTSLQDGGTTSSRPNLENKRHAERGSPSTSFDHKQKRLKVT